MAKITTLDGVTHDVEVGDKVRITLKGGDSSDITVAVTALGSLESKHNFFGGGVIHSLEILERKQVSLPTKYGALVGHPEENEWHPYTLVNGQWYEAASKAPTDEDNVRWYMQNRGFVVLYEGRG